MKIAYSPFILWPVFQQYYVFYGHRMNNDLSISILWPVGRMIRKPGEGRGDSGANWRKRDVGGPVQGAVAVEVGSQGPAALVRP